jgi:hypothetical protein
VHPIVRYVAEESDAAVVEARTLDIDSLKLSEVAEMCTSTAAEQPFWCPELYMEDLTSLVDDVPAEDRWWLPPLPQVKGV